MAMKYLRCAILAMSVIAFASPLKAADYKIDSAHTFVEFKVSHLGFSWLKGRFNDFEGSFTYDPDAGASAQKLNITIKTASIDTNHAERDKRLRSDWMLDADIYPETTFVSTGYEGNAEGGIMHGNLTLHGVSKPIEIAVKKVGEGKDPWGGYRAGFSGITEIKRPDFGISEKYAPQATTIFLEFYVEGKRE